MRYIVNFPYGATWDRAPLHGLGIVDDVQCYRGRVFWHIQPVWWPQGSPLPRWVTPESVTLLNAEAPTAFAVRASA